MFSFCVLTAKKNQPKPFGRLVKTVLELSTVTFWGKLVLWKFVFFASWDIEKKFYAFWQTKLSEDVKSWYYVSGRSFFNLEKLKNAQMCSFCVNPAKKSLRKLVGRVVKSVLVLTRVTFLRKNSSLKICFFSHFWGIE